MIFKDKFMVRCCFIIYDFMFVFYELYSSVGNLLNARLFFGFGYVLLFFYYKNVIGNVVVFDEVK